MANEQEDLDLGDYEGYPIIETGIIINKTGDGLSKAMNVEPVSITPGEKAQIVVGLRKTKDRYDFIRDKSNRIIGVKWIQIFDATVAAFTKSTNAKKELDQMASKIEKAKADAKGQLTLVVGGDENDTPTREKHPDLAEAVDKATKGVKE
jgi:hypothetical protein